jgi:hypothetical protein
MSSLQETDVKRLLGTLRVFQNRPIVQIFRRFRKSIDIKEDFSQISDNFGSKWLKIGRNRAKYQF